MSQPSLHRAVATSADCNNTHTLREKNAGKPVNSLPNELLLDIFWVALGLESERARKLYYLMNTVEYYRDLRKIRLVSWAWSCLIDSAYELWAKVDPFAPEEIWRMALEKSQDTLIDVYGHSIHRGRRQERNSRISQPFAKEFPSFAHRVGYLVVNGIDLADMATKETIMAGLTILELTDFTSDATEPQDLRLGDTLTTWAPNVREVKLSTAFCTWPAPGWTNLKSLKLGINHQRMQIDALQVLVILSASPRLRTIGLSGQIAPASASVLLPKVELLETESLDINVLSTKASLQILDCIVARPSDTFSAFLRLEDLMEPARLRTLGRFVDRGRKRPYRSLAINSTASPLSVLLREGTSTFGVFILPTSNDDGDSSQPRRYDGKIVEGLRQVLEGLGKETLNTIETAEIAIPSLTPLINVLCPSIQCLVVWPLADCSEILLMMSSGSHDSHSGWLLPHLWNIIFSVETPQLLRGISEMIAARTDAHLKGIIPAKVLRARLTLQARVLVMDAESIEDVEAELEKLLREIQTMVPDLEFTQYW
ncbi:hypothetical protein FRB90_001483 [Tulasnella sp. 427]|nr:hypothetical protein FRB90_001483 [Tulasnella sp. 427]